MAVALFAQGFTDLRFERLAVGYRFTEGPAWSKDGYLIFSDTPSDRLLKWTLGKAVEVFRTDAHGPAGNVFDAQGRLYTCETRTRRVTRTDKTGQIEVAAERWEEAFQRAQRDRGQQERRRLFHRPGVRRAERSPRAGFPRRVSYSTEGAR
jgi:hypothetical protein